MKRLSSSIITIFALFLLMGCTSSGDPSSPSVTPEDLGHSRTGIGLTETVSQEASLSQGLTPPEFYFPETSGPHDIVGIWRVRLWDDGRVEILPRRTEQAHVNVTNIVMSCPTCFSIELGPPPGPDTYDFNITLENPTGITGYDVTGIIRSSGDIKYLNPDSYTFLYSVPGDTIPNPFAAWDTGVGNREFPGYGSFTEMLRFEKGGLTKFGEMDYIIQASSPGNQEEPYGIWGLLASDVFLSSGSNGVNLRCRVGDWQGNIDSVSIDLTPVGGVPGTPMTWIEDNAWGVSNVIYSPTGQGVGDHKLLVTATSNGVSTYNYLPVTVISSGPITQGPFEIQYQNLPLEEPNGPSDGMDIAVMGAGDGTQISMVFGGDNTYHFWSSDYQDGSFGLYYADSGDPVEPFDLPNFRFDFSDITIPDSSYDSVFNLSWGETNQSTEILDPDTIPQVMARQRICLWKLDSWTTKKTANVLVIGMDPGPPKTYQVIVRPIEFSSGFRHDGLLYMTLVYDSGDVAQFPMVDIMALYPPLDFVDNPSLISGGYEIPLDEGSGPGVVNRQAIVGVDVDDNGIMPISGGFAGHAWVVVAEAGSENCLEIIDADIDIMLNTFTTVALPAPPVDVEILPLVNAGQPSNAICVFGSDNIIRLYDYSGNSLGTIGGTPYMTGTALRLDIDDTNLAIHALHMGLSSPLVTVYKWTG